MFLGAAIGISSGALKGTQESLSSLETNVVTSSEFSLGGKNIFVDESTELETTQDFKECLLNNANSIGLIQPGDLTDTGNVVLDNIFVDINTAFKQVSATGLQKLSFDSVDKVNEHVDQPEYASQKLCFVIGWDVFQNEAGKDPEFVLEIMTDLEQSNLIDPNTPQDHLYDTFYSETTLSAFNQTDMLQVMATTTKKLIDQMQGSVSLDTFSVLYTPMNTPEYLTLAQDTASNFQALIFEIVIFCVAAISAAGEEPREDMIGLIMKRLGVQKSVLVMRDLLISFSYGYFISLIFAISLWAACWKDSLSFSVILLFVFVAQTTSILRQTILSHIIPRKLGTLISAIIMIFQLAISYALVTPVPSLSLTIIACVISPMLMLQNMFHFGYVAISFGTEVSFATFTDDMFPGISLALLIEIGIIMLAIHGLILLYIWPLKIETDPEKPIKWYYPVQRSFWCGSNESDPRQNTIINAQVLDGTNLEQLVKDTRLSNSSQMVDTSGVNLQDAELELIRKGHLEVPAQSKNEQSGRLVISNLTKRYDNKCVVNDLSLTIYENEILVLLGHNGAGKTTTLNMLTGLIQPSSGSAITHNVLSRPVDLFTDYQSISDFIGLCPQIDVLFTQMTVKENLIFYCKLKNVENMNTVVEETLEKFNLSSKADNWARDISGGQKRKLQLAIALLGNAKIVLLDEPTSGMDPTARRETWELIKQAKQDKIIILTTHYMDEAEYLADRVAVVSKGAFKVCGTTSFLKKKFGQYFYVECDPIDLKATENKEFMDLLQSFNDQYKNGRLSIPNGGKEEESKQLLEIVEESKHGSMSIDLSHGYEPVSVHIDEAGKVVYKLANYMAAHFGEIFNQVDESLETYGVKSYVIRNMTLEQVFITIGDQELQQEVKEENDDSCQIQEPLIDQMPRLQPASLCKNTKSLCIANAQSLFNGGVIGILIGLFIFSLITGLAVFLPISLVTYGQLNYGDPSAIYAQEESSPVIFNPLYADGSPNLIAESLLSSQTVFAATPSDKFNPPVSISNYTDYLSMVGGDIPEDTNGFGAYWVDASQDSSSYWDINAVIYTNASSPASAPVFGNLLLQSVAQTITGEQKLKLGFKYTCYQQNVGSLITKDVNVALPIPTNANIQLMYLEIWLTLSVFFQLTNGSYKTALMRGATRASFVVSRMFCNLAIWIVFFEGFWLANAVIGVDTTGWQIIGLVWCAAQTCYMAAFDALILTNQAWIVLRFIFLGAQMLIISFMGSYTTNLVTNPGHGISQIVGYILFFSPTYQWLCGMLYIFYRYPQYVLQNQDSELEDVQNEVKPFGPYGAQTPLYILLIQIALYSIMMSLIVWRCKSSGVGDEPQVVEPEKDSFETPQEVTQEAQRVENIINGDIDASEDDLIVVHNLVKRYYTKPPADQDNNNVEDRPSLYGENDNQEPVQAQAVVVGFNAVKGTSFGVKRGEVFSLLGVNGAGKSSTFNCLVGYTKASGGTILLDGQNVNSFVGQTELLHGLIGYCPQTNTFNQDLTVKQSLTLFCRLVGIPDASLTAYVDSTIRRFGLSKFPNTLAQNLSGGNMRKLSLALAMVGRPKIIFIDEASTGVDPASRRTMWQAIRHEGQDSAVIMTTHAMEEAEAISQKIAIQVSGFFRSFGTLAQVQREGKSGYYIDVSFDLESLMHAFTLSHINEDRIVRDRSTILEQLNLWENEMRVQKGHDKKLNYADEFKAFGLLDRFHRQIEKGKPVDLANVLRELIIQDNMAGVINSIENKQMKAFVKNYDGAYVQIEVTNCKMTFGQIYAFMESIRDRHSIKEYSCKLSSLEEVFNAHANEAMFMDLNKRIDRRRTSVSFQSLQD